MSRLLRGTGYVTWRLAPSEEPGRESCTYTMSCTMCGQRSPAGEDAETVRRWVFEHVRENRLHMTYRETITRPWTAMPCGTEPG